MSEHLDQTPLKRDRRLPTITVQRPRCPKCDSPKLRKNRTIADQGDGTSLWWAQCECGHHFRVILE